MDALLFVRAALHDIRYWPALLGSRGNKYDDGHPRAKPQRPVSSDDYPVILRTIVDEVPRTSSSSKQVDY